MPPVYESVEGEDLSMNCKRRDIWLKIEPLSA